MGPKKNNADIEKGDTVQAVVIADSFDSKFGPLTTTRPRVSPKNIYLSIISKNNLKFFRFTVWPGDKHLLIFAKHTRALIMWSLVLVSKLVTTT
jgi:hypothetical protein